MQNYSNSKSTPTKVTSTKDQINLDYDTNTEYGDGDVPEIDKPRPSNATNVIPDEVPRRDGPGGQ